MRRDGGAWIFRTRTWDLLAIILYREFRFRVMELNIFTKDVNILTHFFPFLPSDALEEMFKIWTLPWSIRVPCVQHWPNSVWTVWRVYAVVEHHCFLQCRRMGIRLPAEKTIYPDTDAVRPCRFAAKIRCPWKMCSTHSPDHRSMDDRRRFDCLCRVRLPFHL